MKRNIHLINTDEYCWEARKTKVVGKVAELLRKGKGVLLFTSYCLKDFDTASIKKYKDNLHVVRTDCADSHLKDIEKCSKEAVIVIDTIAPVDRELLSKSKVPVYVFLERDIIKDRGKISSIKCDDSDERAIKEARELIKDGKRVIYVGDKLSAHHIMNRVQDGIDKPGDDIVAINTEYPELAIRNESSSRKDNVVIVSGQKLGKGSIGIDNNIKMFYNEEEGHLADYFVVAQAIDYTEKCDGFIFSNHRSVKANSAKEALNRYVKEMKCGYSFVMCLGTGKSKIYKIIE